MGRQCTSTFQAISGNKQLWEFGMKTTLFAVVAALIFINSAHAYTIEKTLVRTRVRVPVWIAYPDKITGKVPGVLLIHGSGGLDNKHQAHEWGYAKALTKQGYAVIIIDSFTPRHVRSTVQNQDVVPARLMARDALTVLQTLKGDLRIDVDRVGVMGFSKGAQAAWLTSLAVFNQRVTHHFATTILMYPPCTERRLNPKTNGKPIHFIVGEKDRYDAPRNCFELEKQMKQFGANTDLHVIPNAEHGWDVPGVRHWDYHGQNFSNCTFVETAPRRWIERKTKIVIFDQRPIPRNRKKALRSCVTHKISGGYNPEAAKASLRLIEGYLGTLKAK